MKTRKRIACGLAAFLISLTLGAAVPVRLRAAAEEIGLRGDYQANLKKTLENPELVDLRHPGLAYYWGEQFLVEYLGGVTRKGKPASGAFADQRPVRFLFMPREISEQLGVKQIGGLTLLSIRYRPETGRVEFPLLITAETPLLLSFPASAGEYRELLTLYREQRLRIRLTSRIKEIRGVLVDKVPRAELEFVSPGVEVLDLLTPKFTRSAGVSVVPRPADYQVTEPEAVAKPKTPVQLRFSPDAFDLDYSEGMQPFRRGWILKDAFPRHRYETADIPYGVIAVCEHPGVPASMTLKFEKPLPAGTYKIAFETPFYRNRDFDNILRFRLGEEEVETAYRFGGRLPWVVAPALRINKPARELTVTAVQAGGGGLSEAPPYYRYWIAISQLFITNDLNDIDGKPTPQPEAK
ncbi:MAG: hypothetical protein BWY73_00322 [candidate division TA06 bacterium ADurb.Bin417]|uniref:Uncharacterized protein n=1 Tax=candidate division TA06 bacterium ADurb.Bin417 TaxID=1852828 RepID=A0A1V5MK35_UNCT6|nr:MAG: hypothetical protein BWY73_00322 [candidate division TA06 bacterium ADurb.Bin417]